MRFARNPATGRDRSEGKNAEQGLYQEQKRVEGYEKDVLESLLARPRSDVTASAASAATLDDVKAKGFVQCGVNTGLAGFSAPDDKGDGRASTSTTAARWRPRSSAMAPR